MSAIDPRCFVCGPKTNTKGKLFQHGNLYLCESHDAKASEVFGDPSASKITESALEARG